MSKRMMISMEHLSTTPDSRAEMEPGAWESVSGIQVCIGNTSALVPKPITINANARRTIAGSSSFVGLGKNAGEERGHMRVRNHVGGVRVISSVPNRPKATPAVQTMMYFLVASRAWRVFLSATSRAEASVVASMAPHNDDVVGRRGQEHRKQEQAVERVVLLLPARGHRRRQRRAGGPSRSSKRRYKADDADDEHKQRQEHRHGTRDRVPRSRRRP